MNVPQLHLQNLILAGADHHPPPPPNESLSRSSSSSKDQSEFRPCLNQLPKDNQRMPYLCAKLRYFKDFSKMACQFCPPDANVHTSASVVCLDSHCDYITCTTHHELCSCKCSFLVNLSDGYMFCKSCHQPAVQHIGGTGAPNLAEALSSVSTTASSSLLPAPPAITTSLLLCQSNSFSNPTTLSSGRTPRRLQNLGNTCYINASLQCLSNCRPTVRYMRKCSAMFRQLTSSSSANVTSEKQQRLARVVVGFGALLSHLRPVPLSSNGSGVFACALSPAAFLRDFAAANPTFRILAQQDAQEFVRLLLDNLHEGLKECSPTLPLTEISNGTASTHKSINKSTVVSQTFGGHLVSNIRCSNCGNVSRTTDGFLDVSLSIPPASSSAQDPSSSTPAGGGGSFWDMFRWNSAPVSLDECLRTFCRSEILTGSERCICEKCKIRTDASKSLSLQTPLPDVLVLHLKRFKYDFFSSKITTHVQFPLESLELAPYCDTESLTHNPGTVTTFRCIGVVKHIGGLGGGHYIAYVRDRHSGKWFECDDSNVREVSRETVQSTEAYMIYYQKMQPHAARVSEAKRKARAWHHSVIHSSKSASADSSVTEPSLPLEPYVYVWADAYNALLTMAELPAVAVAPSPCPHGITHVPQTDRDKLIPLPLSAWRLFSALTASATPPAYTLGKCFECEKSRLESTARRQAERERINSLDRGYLKPGEVWYIISANWLRLWHDYVLDSTGKVASPGPISNAADLLLSDLRTPKPKLQKSDDYRGVVKAVWDQFVGVYGGGPAIIRRTLDLYAVDELHR